MAANEDTLFGRLTKAIVDRVVGSMASRLQKLGQRIAGGSKTANAADSQSPAAPTGLIGRLAQRTTARAARDSGAVPSTWLSRVVSRVTGRKELPAGEEFPRVTTAGRQPLLSTLRPSPPPKPKPVSTPPNPTWLSRVVSRVTGRKLASPPRPKVIRRATRFGGRGKQSRLKAPRQTSRQAWLSREPKQPTPVPVPQDNMIARYTAKDFNAARHKRWVEEHAAWKATEPKSVNSNARQKPHVTLPPAATNEPKPTVRGRVAALVTGRSNNVTPTVTTSPASRSRSRRAVVASSLSASQTSGTVSPSANPTLLDRVLGTMQRTSTGAKRILDAAIMKAESWITSAPQRMRSTLSAPSAKRKGPLSTPGAKRLRTKRIRGLMLGRAKQAWGQIKSIHAARRSIAKQQRNGSLPYDRGHLEKQSLSSIVSAEKSKQSRASWFERTVNKRGQVVTRGRLVNLAKRTGLDFFAKRQNRTRAAGLVKRAKIRLNNAKRRVFKAGGSATPQMKGAVVSAAGRLAQAQGMLAKTTTLASGALGQLAKTGVGAIAALHAFPFAMKRIGEQQVESNRGSSHFSAKTAEAFGRYDLQTHRLDMLRSAGTADSSKDLIDSQMKLREAMIKLEIPITNFLNTVVGKGLGAAQKVAEADMWMFNQAQNAVAEVAAWMIGGNDAVNALRDGNRAIKLGREQVQKRDFPDPLRDAEKIIMERRKDRPMPPIKPLK